MEVAKTVAKSQGLANLPHVVFPRMLEATSAREVEEITGKLTDRIVTLLKEPGAKG